MTGRTTHAVCPRESDLWEAIAAGRWPDATDAELWGHVNGCATCRDVAVVSSGLSQEGATARREASPPSGAIVWWRAQMRARQEAVAAARRPITIAEGLTIASTLGLALAFGGAAITWLHAPLETAAAWAGAAAASASDLAAVGVATRWMLAAFGFVLATLVLAPLAVYVITADD